MKVIERVLSKGQGVRVTFLEDDVLRVQIVPDGQYKDTGLNRYGFIIEPLKDRPAVKVTKAGGGFTAETKKVQVRFTSRSRGLVVKNKMTGKVVLRQVGAGFAGEKAVARFKAAPDEDWVGFGDQTRERLYHRGHTVHLWVTNVLAYIPVPFFMSTRGAGVVINSTHRIVLDMCKSETSHFTWRDNRGTVDYYVFVGENFKELIGKYTDLTGKPKLPPDWSFVTWYISRIHANDAEIMNDALNFRREGIPCGVLGLEPGWMEKEYDFSTEKTWSKERFPVPSYWKNVPHSFFNALKRMGFRLELWLCNRYDLSYEAERRLGNDVTKKIMPGGSHKRAEVEQRMMEPDFLDKETKPEEAWFEHLKKFVDQGADLFKQDGSCQVEEHPDRMYGNGMDDSEMHNLYPLLYSKQMCEGFEEYTNRRPAIFNCSGWIGFQAWCGTWTGDTGGRLDTLGGMLNTSLVGHSWVTNDMEVAEKEGIHLGYLLPWSTLDSWNYFRMPWYQGKELLEIHKDYSRLRSRLVPYIYSWAYQSTQSGLPLMRPLTLEFQDDVKCRENRHQYLLGRDLMVTIYRRKAYFPQGRWKDYWTGRIVEGRQGKTLRWPDNRGGGFFVRAGGIVPHGPVVQYRGEFPVDEAMLYVFPDAQESRMEFYEDDGVSLEHRKGKFATTRISTQCNGSRAVVEVAKTKGAFRGQVKKRTWSFTIAVDFVPASVKANGKALPEVAWQFDRGRKEVKVEAVRGPAKILVSG